MLADNDGSRPAGEDLPFKIVAEFAQAGRPSIALGVPQFERTAHSDSERDGLGAGTKSGLLETAKELGLKTRIVANEKSADTERAAEFVGGDAHRRSAQRAEIDGQLAGDLGCVSVEPDSLLVAYCGEFGDGLNDTRFVVGEHRGDEASFRIDQARQVDRRDNAVCINSNFVDGVAVFGEMVGEGGDAGVFNGRDDEIRLQNPQAADRCRGRRARKKTVDCQVVGFGAAAGENDAVSVSAAGSRTEQLGDSVAGVFQRAAGATAKFVLTGWVQTWLGVASAHRFDDLRQYRRRGVVIEIDWCAHPCHHTGAEVGASNDAGPAKMAGLYVRTTLT